MKNFGISGYKVRPQSGRFLKYCEPADREKSDRLFYSAHKQFTFSKFNGKSGLYVPTVYSSKFDFVNGYAEIEMEELSSDLWRTVWNTEQDANRSLHKAVEFLTWEFENSILQETSIRPIKEKLESIASKTMDRYVITVCAKVSSHLPDHVVLPIGMCHGDFTTTNLLISDTDVATFDFLASPIESVAFDVAKLDQDITHGWFVASDVTDKEYKDVRGSVNNSLDGLFGHLDWWTYRLQLSMLQVLRTVPYINPQTHPKLHNWLQSCIRSY